MWSVLAATKDALGIMLALNVAQEFFLDLVRYSILPRREPLPSLRNVRTLRLRAPHGKSTLALVQLRIEKQARVNLGLSGSCRKHAEQIRHTLACNPK